jgi:tRNA-(ms[2]io[6]A)-hydroxylase
MLNLAAPTRAEWLPLVLSQLDAVLIDHAHCEKKAASTALAFLFRYPEEAALLTPLARLAREELEHFEAVLGVLGERGIRYRHQRPSPYAGRLLEAARSREPERRVDLLLCSALIEARSCERFSLLAENVVDERLAAFYRDLLASEARHHGVYVELASAIAPRDAVRERLHELALHEARVLEEMPRLPRLHT